MNLQQIILRDADRCVLCGICLPHCPTYVRTGNEAESPRGRISLMLALARGQLDISNALINHIDSCLACRACERKCPSEVRYGVLIGNTRRLIAARKRPSLRVRLVAALTSRGQLLKSTVALARTGVGRLALGIARQRALLRMLQRESTATTASTPLTDTPRGRVALFTGCTSAAFDAETVSAAQRLLNAAGYAVEIPTQQRCCGALHHHLGDSGGFEKRAHANLRAFPAERFDAIIFVASGCGTMLKEYATWLDDAQAAPFAQRCVEIADFLVKSGFPEAVRFRATEETVAVHLPCSQANVLKTGGAAERLLKQIPCIRIETLPGNASCCGAAGSYMLTHAPMADALREPKLDALERIKPHYLATTNIGCALHLEAGARERGMAVEVIHPVALLARQLISPSNLAASAETR